MENQTPAEMAGFIIGNLYKCINASSNVHTANCAIYKFSFDDGTTCPEFSYVSGPTAQRITMDRKVYIRLDCLTPAPQKAEKKPHKHAELIKAWADGTVIQSFYEGEWNDVMDNKPSWDEDIKYRVKEQSKYIKVNGMKVPEPYRVKPEPGTLYYTPVLNRNGDDCFEWHGDKFDNRMFKSGQCFKTHEDAVLAYNAMIKPFEV
jgi:hypothetical protein